MQVITSPIPGDLAKLPGVSTGFRPVPVNRGRFVFTGKPGCGKSTLAHSNPKAFILDPEMGGNTADDPRAICFTPDPDSNPETIKNHFEDVKKRLGTMESIVPKIVTKVSELSKFHVDEKPKTEGK
ncbi:hypothetical protein LCGC14_0265070 [marine sediment metagenome]|uniref:Uncharacterized protein n=1 Tax=marine sediment metagenome TaxID=412755 RepID=A0A0F9U5R2_9ZZZZ